MLACADDTAQVVEANEANNCRAAVGDGGGGAGDGGLRGDGAERSARDAGGERASFTATDTDAERRNGRRVGVVDSLLPVDERTLRDAGDVLLTGVRAVPALGAGARRRAAA